MNSAALKPSLVVLPVRQEERGAWRGLMQQHHYLGFEHPHRGVALLHRQPGRAVGGSSGLGIGGLEDDPGAAAPSIFLPPASAPPPTAAPPPLGAHGPVGPVVAASSSGRPESSRHGPDGTAPPSSARSAWPPAAGSTDPSPSPRRAPLGAPPRRAAAVAGAQASLCGPPARRRAEPPRCPVSTAGTSG